MEQLNAKTEAKNVYAFYKAFHGRYGHLPKVSDAAEKLAIKKRTMYYRLADLEKAGVVKRVTPYWDSMEFTDVYYPLQQIERYYNCSHKKNLPSPSLWKKIVELFKD